MAVALPLAAPKARIRQAAMAVVRLAGNVQARGRRLSRLGRARAGYASGLASSAWGVGVVFGFGWALIVGGVATSVSFLLLYDVDASP